MYSDTDNIVVGLMAERVTGVPYVRLIHRELSRRTGDLPETTLPRTVRMPRPLLHGYEIDPPEEPEDVSFPISPAGAWASGGTVSTLPDLGRFFRAYVGGRLFGRDLRGRRIRWAQSRWVKGASDSPGPGINGAGLALFRCRQRRRQTLGRHRPDHSGTGLPNASGVSGLMRRSQVAAVCHALR